MYKMPIEKSRHDYYSTQINLEEPLKSKILNFQKQLTDILESEDEPHITVCYGIKNKEDKDKINQELMSGKLGKLKKFECKDGRDCIVIEVISEDLNTKNKQIRDNFDVNVTFPNYQPHATLAYVKRGSNSDLIGNDYFEGLEFNNLPILFCGKLEKKEKLK